MQGKKVFFFAGLTLICGVLLRLMPLNSECVAGAMHAATLVFLALIGVNVFSLGASEAFRLACARLTSIRKMAFSLMLSVLMCFLGGGILILMLHFSNYIEHTFDITRTEALFLPIAAAIYASTRCFSIWFSARKQTKRARIAFVLPILALAAALLIGRSADERAIGAACAEGVSLIALIALSMKDRVALKPCGLLFRGAPLGILRLILYPLLALAVGRLGQTLIGTRDMQPIALSCGIFGWILLGSSRFYYRLDDMDSENGVFYAAATGTLLFGILLISTLAGLDCAAYAICASIFLLSNAVWALLYASPRRWYLAGILLIACFSCAALTAIGIQNRLCLLAPECALLLIAALLSSRATPEKRRFA